MREVKKAIMMEQSEEWFRYGYGWCSRSRYWHASKVPQRRRGRPPSSSWTGQTRAVYPASHFAVWCLPGRRSATRNVVLHRLSVLMNVQKQG